MPPAPQNHRLPSRGGRFHAWRPLHLPAPLRARAGAGGRPPRAKAESVAAHGNPSKFELPNAAPIDMPLAWEPAQDLLLVVFFAVSHSRTSFPHRNSVQKNVRGPHDDFGAVSIGVACGLCHLGLCGRTRRCGASKPLRDCHGECVLRPGRPRSCGRASGTVRIPSGAGERPARRSPRRARARLVLPRPDRGMCASFANRLRTLSWELWESAQAIERERNYGSAGDTAQGYPTALPKTAHHRACGHDVGHPPPRASRRA